MEYARRHRQEKKGRARTGGCRGERAQHPDVLEKRVDRVHGSAGDPGSRGVFAGRVFGQQRGGDTGEEEGDQARVKLLNIVKVEIDGPSVAVSDGLNGAKYFHVKHIRIYIDSELSEAEQEVLKQNIELRKSEISSKLASFVRQQSIVDLMNRVMIHEMLADKLKPEIIKLLEVTDREIKDVQISNLDYS